jgi:hypothetical protein
MSCLMTKITRTVKARKRGANEEKKGGSPSQPITAAGLAPLFDEAFAAFLGEERENLLSGIAEQNLCGRLAMELERRREGRGLNGYFVDTEYNRNGGRIKTIIDEQMQMVTIRCDIILHSRGHIRTQDNLLVIEMKRSNHREAEKAKDRMRLRAMTKSTYNDVSSADGHTLPEHVCGYVLGYYLELDAAAEEFLIEVYADGALAGSRQASF